MGLALESANGGHATGQGSATLSAALISKVSENAKVDVWLDNTWQNVLTLGVDGAFGWRQTRLQANAHDLAVFDAHSRPQVAFSRNNQSAILNLQI
jgi:hypothetical protein